MCSYLTARSSVDAPNRWRERRHRAHLIELDRVRSELEQYIRRTRSSSRHLSAGLDHGGIALREWRRLNRHIEKQWFPRCGGLREPISKLIGRLDPGAGQPHAVSDLRKVDSAQK